MITRSSLFKTASTFLMLSLAAACSGGGDDDDDDGPPSTPVVSSNAPASGATDVARNALITATFSEAMDPASLTPVTFTLSSGATPVQGTVIYSNATATFLPAVFLASNGSFTATVTTGALSVPGIALAANHSWSFTTGNTISTGLPVNLGTSANYAILAKSAISTVPASAITGDIAVSPAAASFITGFALTLDASTQWSTSTQVTGKVYAADYAPPTPSNLTTAVGDMQIAFTDAAGRAAGVTELGAGDIGGMTLAPGVYKWTSGLLIPTDLTLDGSATDVWIFQIAQNLTLSNDTSVILAGNALPKNVFWQVSGAVTVGTDAHLEGNVLSQTSITLGNGASVNGRLLAQTAVALDGNTIVKPAP